jgi:2-polyprenyl-6-methoxyphenol hydroxylase-like FAD-dependent oxidoreductase
MLKYPDIEVRVYEGAHKFEEIGAGLGVWQRIAKILEELGIGVDFEKAATWPPKGEKVSAQNVVHLTHNFTRLACQTVL